MHIHQISVFLENRTGQLAEITRLLAEAQVDIRAISIAETSDYGLARMIVDDSYKASSILLQHGDILSMTPVWAVEVPDRPGGLAEVLGVLADAHVERYIERKFTNLMFSFGCTGGQHRSVYCAEHLAQHIAHKYDVKVFLYHREQGIEKEL